MWAAIRSYSLLANCNISLEIFRNYKLSKLPKRTWWRAVWQLTFIKQEARKIDCSVKLNTFEVIFAWLQVVQRKRLRPASQERGKLFISGISGLRQSWFPVSTQQLLSSNEDGVLADDRVCHQVWALPKSILSHSLLPWFVVNLPWIFDLKVWILNWFENKQS